MGYGRSYPLVEVPLTFQCQQCLIIVTINVDAGKDYIYEDTVSKGRIYMEDHCNWYMANYGRPVFEGHSVLCHSCRPPSIDEPPSIE